MAIITAIKATLLIFGHWFLYTITEIEVIRWNIATRPTREIITPTSQSNPYVHNSWCGHYSCYVNCCHYEYIHNSIIFIMFIRAIMVIRVIMAIKGITDTVAITETWKLHLLWPLQQLQPFQWLKQSDPLYPIKQFILMMQPLWLLQTICTLQLLQEL